MNQAGGVAAPVGGQIFSEILPYLEVNQGNLEEVEIEEEIETPDLLGKTLREAKELAKKSGVEIVVKNEEEELDEQDILVKEQVPSAGIKIKKGSRIYISY